MCFHKITRSNSVSVQVTPVIMLLSTSKSNLMYKSILISMDQDNAVILLGIEKTGKGITHQYKKQAAKEI